MSRCAFILPYDLINYSHHVCLELIEDVKKGIENRFRCLNHND